MKNPKNIKSRKFMSNNNTHTYYTKNMEINLIINLVKYEIVILFNGTIKS